MPKESVPIKPPWPEIESPIELYRLYRDYIEHEDELINNRVGWFIQLHSFLIASYGIVFAAELGTFFSDHEAMVPPIIPQSLAAMLLIGIAVVGLESSSAAYRSINAAHHAVTALEGRWETRVKPLGGGEIFPHIIGGGARKPRPKANFCYKIWRKFRRKFRFRLKPRTIAEDTPRARAAARAKAARDRKKIVDDGANFHMRLPSALWWLWIISFTVPAVFVGLALFELLSGAGTGATQVPHVNIQISGRPR